MSTFTLNVPSSYPWVIGVAAALPLLNIWQILQVVDARKKAGVKYPQIYATKEEQEKSKDALVFNCTQRAHQNTLEYLPHFVLLLLISGLRTPRLSTVAGAIWILGRIVYTLGYASTNPKARQRGAGISYIGIFTLLGANLYTVFTLLREIDFQF